MCLWEAGGVMETGPCCDDLLHRNGVICNIKSSQFTGVFERFHHNLQCVVMYYICMSAAAKKSCLFNQ